jgi:hypothetical protein
MNSKVKELLEKLEKLEDELLEELHEQKIEFQYKFEGSKVKFENAVTEAHLELKTGFIQWFKSASWRNTLSAPVIYSMIVPLAIADLTFTIYQAICFRLYGIPRVRRAKYIVVDRHYLSFLNGIEKFNCVYCAYGNGVISYTREIISRTEQYWCPIKHARRITAGHRRYAKFIEYGDAKDYKERVLKFREDLKIEKG